jgi:hypothetical protein
MIVASVVNAVAGEEIENVAPVVGLQDSAATAYIPDIHFENVEQTCPLGVYVLAVKQVRVFGRGNSANPCGVPGDHEVKSSNTERGEELRIKVG